MKRLVTATLVGIGLAVSAAACVPTQSAVGGPELTVKTVIDGDTVDLNNGQRVRLIGIDAQESGTGQCATQATARLRALVLNQRVTASPGARDDTDRYGRLLRYLDTAGRDAGRVLIDEGLAVARYDSRDGYGGHPREHDYVAADMRSPNCVNTPVHGDDPRFGTCTEAKRNGFGPYHIGIDPEYGWYQDADHDGIACE